MTQNNFKKHQSRCAKSILDGPIETVMPPENVMTDFWVNSMTRDEKSAPPDEDLVQPEASNIWAPVAIQEILGTKPSATSAPGPDGIPPRLLRATPTDVLVRLYNLILWCEALPLQQRDATTTLIPKKKLSKEPGDFRPITVPSVITRHLNAILAARFAERIQLDPRQRAFIKTDGCADNTILLDLILRFQHEKLKSCFLASLDVSKAFDSVSHNAILGILRSYGFHPGFINYIHNSY